MSCISKLIVSVWLDLIIIKFNSENLVGITLVILKS